MRRFPMLDSHFKKEEFKKAVKENVKMLYRKTIDEATQQQIFQAVSLAVKDVIIDNWLATQKQYEKDDPKIVYYLSMEFLMGRALGNNLINLTAYKEVKEALDELGFDLNVIEDQEPDPALGNGGLGRLAACFLDSLATLGYCAYGCGIRYHYGLFKQKIEDGYQIEVPDNWLKDGYPFELRRPEYAKEVKFGGYVRVEYDAATGRNQFIQEGYQSVMAIPYDMPIVGYNNKIVNTLRIWDAEPITDFRLDLFDKGEYHKAVEQENLAGMCVQERFFCRFFCPMGAVFSLLPVLPFFSLHRTRENCRKGCKACTKTCPSQIGLPSDGDWAVSGDCFQCQKCIDICPQRHIHCGIRKLKGNEFWFTILRALILLGICLWLGL